MKPSTDPTRDPASEARDDHAVDESEASYLHDAIADGIGSRPLADYRDPSKSDREPKFRVSPNPPPEAEPVPEGWRYFGVGPLDYPYYDLLDSRETNVRCLLDDGTWSVAEYTGESDELHYIVRYPSETFNKNFIYDEH